jgi:4-hydroxybenzoate polyprenyltransferase
LSAGLIGLALLATPLTGIAQSIALMGPLTYWMHMMWQLKRLDINDPDRCMHLFRSNRDTGLLIVLFFACAAIL